jgi:DNA repair exonuclease SbcCD ATPase subunit
MSQTETILLIVLGFSLATLIALFMARGLWTAAVKVGARRMQRQVPSSLVGLQTERDRLRAEYAMLSQRLGARLETAKLQMAEQMAEVSRHRNRLHELEALEANRGADNRRLAERIGELEYALAQSRADEQSLRQQLAAKDETLAKAARTQKPHRPAPDAPPVHAAPPVDEAESRLRQRIDRLTELAKAPPPDDFIIHAPPPPEDDPVLAERMDQAERETEELTRDLEKLDAEWQQRLSETGPVIAESEADANVISLSNRIRDLKKSLGSAS